jgi:hypothetical protein
VKTKIRVVTNKVSKRGIGCLLAMSQADKPTYGEFLAAWEEGLLDFTPKATEALKKYTQDLKEEFSFKRGEQK